MWNTVTYYIVQVSELCCWPSEKHTEALEYGGANEKWSTHGALPCIWYCQCKSHSMENYCVHVCVCVCLCVCVCVCESVCVLMCDFQDAHIVPDFR